MLNMLELNAGSFYNSAMFLNDVEHRANSEISKGNGDSEPTSQELTAIDSSLYRLREASENLNAIFCRQEIERFRLSVIRRAKELKGDPAFSKNARRTYADISKGLDVIRQRFKDEIIESKALVFERELLHFYSPPKMYFGKDVLGVFPEMEGDLGEALHCLALSRPTACVFHLMRALELAVQAVGTKLNATVKSSKDTFLPWGIIVSNVGQKIQKLTQQQQKQEWTHVNLMLNSVKDAWRNPTMHPNTHYSVEQGREIIEAVRSFLEALRKSV
jgi:hypothetical protein